MKRVTPDPSETFAHDSSKPVGESNHFYRRGSDKKDATKLLINMVCERDCYDTVGYIADGDGHILAFAEKRKGSNR